MLFQTNRSPKVVEKKRGKRIYQLSYALARGLNMLVNLGPNEAPPPGLVTATGMLRKRVFQDLAMSGLAQMKGQGFIPSREGREAQENHEVVTLPPDFDKRSFQRLLASDLEAIRRHRQLNGNGSKRAAA
jgi:hypothetical protein